jgi:translation initiation factor 4E
MDFLNDNWILYFHDPFLQDWSKGSYKELCKIDTIQSFWRVHKIINEKLTIGMFFLFREHIFPLWDDEYNKDGGCVSIKVLKEKSANFWESMSMKVLGEKLLFEDNDFTESINGISISPKKNFCIVKIWVKEPFFEKAAVLKTFNISKDFHGTPLYNSFEN